MHLRRWYYDRFSLVYDGFIRLHSRDAGESMRSFLVHVANLKEGCRVVDLCTGTGSSAVRMATAGDVRVVGLDFSEGMLRQARRKLPPAAGCWWVQAEVTRLPISSGSADRVTCTYAMYELSGSARTQVLKEVVRVLRPGGMFLMMEHMPPRRPLLRLLYTIRIYVLGTRGVRSFAGREEPELAHFFDEVGTVIAPGGGTKVVYGLKGPERVPCQTGEEPE